MKVLQVALLAMLLVSCGTGDEYPAERSSDGLRMDGTRRIHSSKVPGSVKLVDFGDSLDRWATGTVPLAYPLRYAIATESGKILLVGEGDSLNTICETQAEGSIRELLANDSLVIFVTQLGECAAFDYDGKMRWRAVRVEADSQASLSASPVLASGVVLLPLGTRLTALNASTGKEQWSTTRVLTCEAVSVRGGEVLSFWTENRSGGRDSIVQFTTSGEVKRQAGFDNVRLISNACWFADDAFAAGYISATATSLFPRVALFHMNDRTITKTWSAEVPYLPTNLGSDTKTVYASGFRFSEGETESGVDAFRIADTVKLWQRRFSEPVAAPLAIGPDALFFPLSFAGEAHVPTRALLFSLNSEDGKTLSERPIREGNRGAMEGVLARIAMPDENGRLILADRERLRLWILSD